MWLDLVLFGVLVAFALLGGFRGALESGLKLLSLGACYAIAVVAARSSGPALGEAFGLSPLVAMPVAGTLGFLAGHVLFALGIVALRASRRRRDDEGVRGAADRLLGAAFGFARGGLLVLLVGWLGLLVGALHEGGVATALPDPGPSHVARWSGKVAGAGARRALGGDAPAARMVEALAAEPGRTLKAARAVVAHHRVVELQRDGVFWSALEAGRVEHALTRSSFDDLAHDAALREELADLGLIDDAAAATPEAFSAAMEPVLREVGARVAALRSDPEFQALLRDPEILGLLERGDTFGVLAHPRFQSLVRRVAAAS